jgi:hypothetical protein
MLEAYFYFLRGGLGQFLGVISREKQLLDLLVIPENKLLDGSPITRSKSPE